MQWSRRSNSGDMINFVFTPHAQEALKRLPAMETMHFFHSAKEFIFENIFFYSGGPNEGFGTHEKLPCKGANKLPCCCNREHIQSQLHLWEQFDR